MGVIGCGGVACQYHLRFLARSRSVDLQAIADPRPDARERAAALTGVRDYPEAAELLALPDIEAVVICAENRVHAELAEAAAAAGKHFYLEKPIALTASDARFAVEVAERAGVTATIGFNFRFLPFYSRARALIRESPIGDLRRVRTRFCEPVSPDRMPAWKRERASGGGALLDLGSHHLDLLPWLCGEEIARIETATLRSEESEHDSASLRGATSTGATVEAEFSYRQGRICQWELEGERGRLVLDRHAGRTKFVAGSNGRFRGGSIDRLRARLLALPLPRREPSFALALAAFTERLQGEPKELPTLGDGARSLDLVLEAEAVAATG
jgi:predicted dehydrogenase